MTGLGQNFSTTQLGYTIGAGLEYAVQPNWTTRIEYRYTDYDSAVNRTALGSSIAGAGFRQEPNFHQVRVGLSYRF